MKIRMFATAMAVLCVLAGAATAQSDAIGGGPPQPAPPEGFDGQEYVDDRGCLYIRAGVGAETTWVPRVNRARQPICEEDPGAAPDAVAVPTPVDEGSPDVVAVPVPVTEGDPDVIAVPTPVTEGAPQPFEPDITIRSGPGSTTEADADAVPVTDPEPEPAADPDTAVPVVVTDAAPAAEAEPEAPLAEETAAVSTQPLNPQGMILPPIAQPGGPAAIDRVFSPARIGTPMPPVVAGQPRIIRIPPHTVPERIPVMRAAKSSVDGLAPRADGSIRATRRAVCGHSAETGQVFINRATGQPVRCGHLVQINHSPEAPSAPAHIRPSGTVAVAGYGVTYRAPVSHRPTRAEVFARSDVNIEGVRATLDGTDRRLIPSGLIQREAVPASNPVGRIAPVELRTIPSPPAGYRSVWGDGRINMQRGVIVRDYFYGGG